MDGWMENRVRDDIEIASCLLGQVKKSCIIAEKSVVGPRTDTLFPSRPSAVGVMPAWAIAVMLAGPGCSLILCTISIILKRMKLVSSVPVAPPAKNATSAESVAKPPTLADMESLHSDEAPPDTTPPAIRPPPVSSEPEHAAPLPSMSASPERLILPPIKPAGASPTSLPPLRQ